MFHALVFHPLELFPVTKETASSLCSGTSLNDGLTPGEYTEMKKHCPSIHKNEHGQPGV